ncbi:MAG TPA: exosortase H [Halieaceae bacterium]|nr:exosortase H [Haliea sp.]HAN67772.1 exosortase H [Halieaceae bacterium]MBK40596.1 exosortase H [Haliea sp.]MBP68695.1 exosortase H [Haliea sp.]HBQ39280.1 exosortase H [Halieaceae bacterium]
MPRVRTIPVLRAVGDTSTLLYAILLSNAQPVTADNSTRMSKFILIFLVVLVALFTLEMLAPVQAAVVQPFTASLATLSAALITPFDSDVIAYGRVIAHSVNGFAVSIESGCNGVEAAIVLIAGVLAYPAPWRYRLLAILAGFLTIQVLNIVRIISLFYLGQWNLDIFNWTHLYLWPVFIMLDVLIVFILYLRLLERRPQGVTA